MKAIKCNVSKETKIKERLEHNYNLTKTQVSWVKDNIEPKYENDCNNCRINVLLYFGYSFEEAADLVNNQAEADMGAGY